MIMKKQYLLLIAVPLICGFSACKEKQKSDDIIVAKYVPEGPKDPIKMSTDRRQNDIDWLGRSYSVRIVRQAADSMSMLKDETGQKYYDNRVVLTILRSDSSVFVRKVFTKETFSSYVDADFRQKGILENVVFHGVDSQMLKFGVVISRPGSDDEFVPLDLTIDKNGGMSIAQGKLFDSNNEDESEDGN